MAMKKKRISKFNAISLISIFLFFLVMGIYLSSIFPTIQGDGGEYILQTVAFQREFHFGISESDVTLAKEQFYNNQVEIQRTYDTIIRDDRGIAYSNHFGAYSVIVTPTKLILLSFGIYPLWAFSITNLLLWLSALIVVFIFLRVDDERKLYLILLLMFNPIFFYLDWVHTEMFIYSFIVSGLVFFFNKQYRISILLLSISAMQNLAVLPFASIVGLNYIFDLYSNFRKTQSNEKIAEFIKINWLKIISYGIYFLPAFIPMILTFYRFGTYNRVAEVAMENKFLLKKALDYIFDLNLGILPFEPIMLFAFIFLIILGLIGKNLFSILYATGVAGILYIIAHQIQINSAMQSIMRYSSWIVPIMIFFVILHWKFHDKKYYLRVITIMQISYTTSIVVYIVWGGGYYSHLQFAPWTKVVLDVAPQVYNPTHGIFYSRAQHKESYDSLVPVFYRNEQGYLRKILLSKNGEKAFYSDKWIILDDNEKVINKNDLKKISVDEGIFKYINMIGNKLVVQKYDLGDEIFFNLPKYNALDFVLSGIAFPEETMSWTDGDELNLVLWLEDDSSVIFGKVSVEYVFFQPQDVVVLINDTEVHKQTINMDQDIVFSFKKPRSEIIRMTILIPNSVSPSEVMISRDNRDLGIAIQKIEFSGESFDIEQ